MVSAPDVPSAQAAAADQGTSVEVASLEDATSTTVANPDGTLTKEMSQTPARVMRDGAWVDVDYDLQHVDGGWAPKVSPVPVVFSDGGDKDAVTLGDGTKQVDVSWAVTLPAPQISGAVARYDLGDGESLVLIATYSGFEQSLILEHAPASLPRIKLPLDSSDLTMNSDDHGGFVFANADGTVVYSMPGPVMYDAAVDPDTGEPAQAKPVTASLVQTSSGPELDLTPSMTWLQDPARTYPVTIDPSIASVSRDGDTYIQDNVTTSMASAVILHAGEWGGHAARAFMKFSGVDALADTTITAAWLNLWNNGANTCSAAPFFAFELSAPFLYNNTWADPKPPYASTHYGTTNFANGNETASPSCPNATASVWVKDMVQDWASDTSTNFGIMLGGYEYPGAQGWSFCSMNLDTGGTTSCTSEAHKPTLAVTYTVPPPYDIDPATMCAEPSTRSDCSDANHTSSVTPTLTASTTDLGGSALTYSFEVWSTDGSNPVALVASGQAANIASGGQARFTTPVLTYEGLYTFRVRATSQNGQTAWSPWHNFVIEGEFALGVGPCTDVCRGVAITNSLTPQLSVALPSFEETTTAVDYTFQVYSGSASSPDSAALLGTYTAHSDDAFNTTYLSVPAGVTRAGSTYEYRVSYTMGGSTSAWSPFTVWSVDTTSPAAPAVSSSTWVSGQATTATSGTITWSSSSSDVTRYAWGLDDQPEHLTRDTQATIDVGSGSHAVRVEALDSAGNPSAATSFVIAGSGTATSNDQTATDQVLDADGQPIAGADTPTESPTTAANEATIASNATQTYHSSLSSLTNDYDPSTTNTLCDNPDYAANTFDENAELYPDLNCTYATTGPTSGQGQFTYDYATKDECRGNRASYGIHGSDPGWVKDHFSWCSATYLTFTYNHFTNKVQDKHYWISARVTVVGHGQHYGRVFRMSQTVDYVDCGGWPISVDGCAFWGNQKMSLGIAAYYYPNATTIGCPSDGTWVSKYWGGLNGWIEKPSVYRKYSMSESSGTSGAEKRAYCVFEPWFTNELTGKTFYMPSTGGRCDSASYIVNVRGSGCIFDRIHPVWFVYGGSNSNVRRIALHIYDAQKAWLTGGDPPGGRHHIEPNSSWYDIPGEWAYAPLEALHRQYPAPVRDRTKIRDVCLRYWPYYQSEYKDCDEYPFNSTREGPSHSDITAGEYSVRPVNTTQNRRAGAYLGNWYRNDRILDGDAFWVSVYGL